MERVAVFIDGDNLRAELAPKVMKLAKGAGRVDVCSVYGNSNSQKNWVNVMDVRFIFAGCDKNGADLLLALDAMDACQPGVFQTVVLASSDADFMHLAQRLRSRGIAVLGIGEAKAKERFQKSCTRFINLQGSDAMDPEIGCVLHPTSMDYQIHSVICEASKGGSGILINQLGHRMRELHDVQISTRPEKKWRTYLAKRTKLYDLDPKGPNAHVRFQKQAFPAKAA